MYICMGVHAWPGKWNRFAFKIKFKFGAMIIAAC